MTQLYSSVFRERALRRLVGPDATSANLLASEIGVSQSTLSRWLRDAANVGGMSRHPDQPRSAREKLRAVIATATLSEQELGAYLRQEGLHEADVRQWRAEAETALSASTRGQSAQATAEAKRIHALERELHRKEQALAEMAALLVLKKKAQAIWGDAADDTPDPNAR